jgi:Fe-S cluster biogenesis protein NfuA
MNTEALATSDLIRRVEESLDSIRPYLEADGGNVKVLEVTDTMIVKLELLGACGTCPMSAMTLRAGVEEAIKKAVPEIKGVLAINLTAPDDPRAQLPGNMI